LTILSVKSKHNFISFPFWLENKILFKNVILEGGKVGFNKKFGAPPKYRDLEHQLLLHPLSKRLTGKSIKGKNIDCMFAL